MLYVVEATRSDLSFDKQPPIGDCQQSLQLLPTGANGGTGLVGIHAYDNFGVFAGSTQEFRFYFMRTCLQVL